MTSQVSCKIIDVGLEKDECRECEGDDHAPNEPWVHWDSKHSGLGTYEGVYV